jgi:tight adherence protein B
LALVLTQSVILALTAGVAVGLLVWVGEQLSRSRRQRRFEDQIVPTVGMLAAALRAGFSLGQALERVARDGPKPTAEELARAVREVELGVGTEEALISLADRIGGEDYKVLAMMLIVHRRVGGNLAPILDSLADTVRQRAQLRQEIATLTAQQRLATYVLVALPILVSILFTVLNPPFMRPMFTTTLGQILVGIAGILLLLGWIGIRAAGRVDV